MIDLRQLLRTGVLTIIALLLLPCALLLLAVIVPVVPWLRIYASDVVPNAAGWLLAGAMLSLIVVASVHRCRTTTMTWALLLFASVTIGAAGLVAGRLLYVSMQAGARINLLRTLSTRHFSEAKPDASHVYAAPAGERLWLDVYRPPAAVAPRAPGPVLVFVHGGGFTGGDRRMSAANMRRYADGGWTVVSVDYRLARAGRPTWDLAVADVRCAMAWVAAHAKALNVDIGRMALNGASAGGNLALAAAYTPGTAAPGCGGAVPRVAAVVARAPLIDPAGSWDHPGELRGEQRRYMTAYLGGPPARYPDRYAAVDIRRHITRGLPPTLILVGAEDPLLPLSAAQQLATQSRAQGNSVALVAFPYAGHDFNTTYDGIPNQAVRQIVAAFLNDHDRAPAAR